MNRGWVERAVLALALGGMLSVGTAYAQDAATPAATPAPAPVPAATPSTGAIEPTTPAANEPKPKPRKAKTKRAKPPSITVVVVNHRSVGLVELTAAPTGGAEPVKIAGPLAAGKKTIAHLAHDKACLFDLRGEFADEAETETESYDLCKNKTIDLVD